METISLSSTGDKMPLVGFGTWKIPKDVCKDVVFKAIKSGYRLIDCAPVYANEVEVGQGIKQAIDEGIVTRSDLFITSKLWSTHHRKEHVLPAIERTLKDLNLDYVDLYLIHSPLCLKYVPIDAQYPPTRFADPVKKNIVVDQVPQHETWAGMEQLVASGLARNIGVSNVNAALLIDLQSYARIKPSVLQMELHPYLTRKQLVAYAQSCGIAITAYSSFGDASYYSIGMVNQGDDFVPLLDNPAVCAIAASHGVTASQVLLKWALQQNIAVIPKSCDAGRIALNRNVDGFSLDSSEMGIIDGLNTNLRFVDPANSVPEFPLYAN
ncbi:4-dihydromethyl-trisporate dehydrogenase [Smittium culicis]|uniref:4-dihydromethyl-trisporate dehydrogenase n=1 Tax=Smittium culicis TaxID=133412 RepID=A0A1R1YM99_9FUNG|nr:4-dihydromethyl-trisporate dehydrogenase [Smittium culicis]